jgi:hypothetical protein
MGLPWPSIRQLDGPWYEYCNAAAGLWNDDDGPLLLVDWPQDIFAIIAASNTREDGGVRTMRWDMFELG